MARLIKILALLLPLCSFGQTTITGATITGAYVNSTVGEIFNESSFASTSNFPITGSSITRSSGQLDMTGNPSLFTSYVLFDDATNSHRYTALEKWDQWVRVKVSTTKTATSYGIGVGVLSANGWDVKSTSLRWSWDTSGAGRFYLYNINAITNQIVSANDAQGAYSATANTFYWIHVNRNYNVITTRIFSDAMSLLFSISQSFTMSSGYVVLHNTGRFCIQHFGGDGVQVTDWIVSSTELVGAVYCGVGDSNMHGMHVATVAERFMNIAAATVGKSVVVNAGISDRTAEVLLRVPEIIALKPKNVILSIGRNDIADGVAQATYEANITTIITDLEAAGITVKLAGVFASNVNVSGLQTFYTGKANTQINGYTTTKGAGTAINATYNAGDNIHFNTAGNAAIGASVATIM